MIRSLVLRVFSRFTSFNPEFLEWLRSQELESAQSSRRNFIEAEVLKARKEAHHAKL